MAGMAAHCLCLMSLSDGAMGVSIVCDPGILKHSHLSFVFQIFEQLQ